MRKEMDVLCARHVPIKRDSRCNGKASSNKKELWEDERRMER
jgi:hypothetical protein